MCALTHSTEPAIQICAARNLILRAIAWICLCSIGLVASAQDASIDSRVAQEFAVSKARVLDLEFHPTQRGAVEAEIMINGQQLMIEMHSHSVRSSNFVLLEQIDDGSLVERVADSPRTVLGTLKGNKGSRIIGCLLDEGLAAKIVMRNGQVMFIEPIGTKLKDPEFAGRHILYRSDDTLPHAGKCGIEGAPLHRFENVRIANQRSSRFRRPSTPPVSNGTTPGGGGIQVAELAVDADFEYFSDYGSVQATLDRMELIVNIVNNQYEDDVEISHVISGAIVRSSANDPYTSSDPLTLVNQVRAEWLTNQQSIQRDVAHLFTGREIDGNVIGTAFVGTICGTSAYGYSQSDFNNQLACATDLTAHELGHNWNAGHCNCSGHTMNPSITCSNEFNPTFTIPDIIAFRNSLDCLDSGGGPNNDNFENAIAIGDGTVGFNTTGTNTDGPALPASCDEGFGLSLVNDLWYNYTATCTGEATFDFCSSLYDTRVAAYTGAGAGPGSLIACNDDFCGLQSQMTFAVVDGEDYLIRVGGFNTGGAGTMVVSCSPSGSPVDISVVNNELLIDGTVGADDILVTQNGNILEVAANQASFETFALQDINRVVINGFDGDDTINIDAAVNAMIDGGSGADDIMGSSLSNEIIGGPGDDIIIGGPQIDVIDGANGADMIFGSGGNDEIFGGGGDDMISAGNGSDTCSGGTGNDMIDGENGNDDLLGGGDDDIMFGGDGNDTMNGFDGRDRMEGGNGDDDIFGGRQRDIMLGGNGADLVSGQGGNDVVRGGNDNDEVLGGAGRDNLFGDGGMDILSGNGGNDFFNGGAGNDMFFGGAGFDTALDVAELGQSSIEN